MYSKILRLISFLIAVFIALQFTQNYNLVSLYFNNKQYKEEINTFIEVKNNNLVEYNKVLEDIKNNNKNSEKMELFKDKKEKYYFNKKYTYTQIKSYLKDVKRFEFLNNIVEKVRSSILMLAFVILLIIFIKKKA